MLKKILFLIVALTCTIFGAVLAFNNSQEVAFDYIYGQLPAPFVLFLFIAFALGVILTVAISSFWVFKQHRQIKRLENSKALVQKELDSLRALRGEG